MTSGKRFSYQNAKSHFHTSWIPGTSHTVRLLHVHNSIAVCITLDSRWSCRGDWTAMYHCNVWQANTIWTICSESSMLTCCGTHTFHVITCFKLRWWWWWWWWWWTRHVKAERAYTEGDLLERLQARLIYYMWRSYAYSLTHQFILSTGSGKTGNQKPMHGVSS